MKLQTYGKKPLWLRVLNAITIRPRWISIPYSVNLSKLDRNEEEW